MPNRQKRKTPAVKPDFEKKKRKVGKGKQPAENVTPLNFKSRSIFVPAQLGESSPQEPTTYRRHGLQVYLPCLDRCHNLLIKIIIVCTFFPIM